MPKFQIKIESILGGISPNLYLGRANQYHAGIGIDIDRPVQTSGVTRSGGVLTPSSASDFSGAALTGYPVWFLTNPKDLLLYVYTNDGKFISYSGFASETGLTTPTSGAGNGAAYYNNYLYLATPTDIARYGPLDGTPTLTQTVWTGATFGKTALGNPAYPTQKGVAIPNHPMHVHIDSKLYVGDYITAAVADKGRGVIHWIRTKRVTDEGDTNDGTTYGAFLLPFGYAPVDIESWGTDLVVLAIPMGGTTGDDVALRRGNAKLFFWDAINAPSLPYRVVELSDPIATALLMHSGNLYIWSGSYGTGIATKSVGGVRVSRYLGGISIQQIAFLEEGLPPIAGGVAAHGNRIAWSGYTSYPEDRVCVWALGSKDGNYPFTLHNIVSGSAAPGANNTWMGTALAQIEQPSIGADPRWLLGWKDGAVSQDFGIDRINAVANTCRTSVFRSLLYSPGRPFKINKISIPLGSAIAANMTLIATIFTDDLSSSQAQTTINNTNYAGSQRRIVQYPTFYGNNNFCLQLRWTGTAILPVILPIIIEGETLEDATG